MAASTHQPPRPTALAILVLLWLTGLYLRVPILVAPALAPYIDADLGLSQTGIGALTTLPVLMLAIGALPGSLAISRLGARNTLMAALLLVAVGSAARGLAPPSGVLFIATAVMGLGVAIMQPALPAVLPLWCPGFLALGSAVYMNGMLLGEFVGAGLTLPLLMPLTGFDWRWTLLLWSLPALAIAGALAIPRARRATADNERPHWQPEWRDRRVWQLGGLLGAAAVVFFGTNAYTATILEARGETDRLAATLLVFNLSQVIASLTMLAVGRRLLKRRGPVIATTIANVAGLLAFVTLKGNTALAGGVVVGFSSAMQLILLVSLPPQITDADNAGRLAAGMFAIGYGVASVVPLAGGMVADMTGQPRLALIPILLYAAASMAFALRLDAHYRARDLKTDPKDTARPRPG